MKTLIFVLWMAGCATMSTSKYYGFENSPVIEETTTSDLDSSNKGTNQSGGMPNIWAQPVHKTARVCNPTSKRIGVFFECPGFEATVSLAPKTCEHVLVTTVFLRAYQPVCKIISVSK